MALQVATCCNGKVYPQGHFCCAQAVRLEPRAPLPSRFAEDVAAVPAKLRGLAHWRKSLAASWNDFTAGRWSLRLRTGLYVALGLAFVVWGYRAWATHPVQFDDAYISARYAYNLAHGHGVVYNVGEKVEGYTNFLWVIISAIGIGLGGGAFATMRTWGVLSYVLTIALCVFVIAAASKRSWRGLIVVPMAALLILPHGAAQMAGSGMETTAVAFLAVLHGVTGHVWQPKSRWGLAFAKTIPLLLCLLRPDMAPLYLAALLARFVQEKLIGNTWWQAARATFVWFAPSAIGLVAYHAWRVGYYGALLPNTYWAKHGHVSGLDPGLAYLDSFLKSDPQVWLLLPLAASAVFLVRAPHWRGFSVYAGLATAFYVAYVVKVGGDFMHYRFMFHIYPLFVVLAAVGVVSLAWRSRVLAAICVVAPLTQSQAPFVGEGKYGMQSLEAMNVYAHEGKAPGRRLGEALPPDTIIATTLAGTIAYYSKLTTVDQWGLNDRHVAKQRKVGRPTRGHEKAATTQYLRERGVNLYLHHPKVCSCESPCFDNRMVREYPQQEPREAGIAPSIFLKLDEEHCLRMWYLVQKKDLTEYMCSRPDEFVMGDFPCPTRPANDSVRAGRSASKRNSGRR